MISRACKAAIAALMLLPAVLAFSLIALYGVNVAYWDEWSTVPLFEKLYTNNLTFNDFIAQHNEHRILTYRLIVLPLGHLTHWNNVAEMYFSWVLLCLACFVLYRMFTVSNGTSWRSAALFIPVPWLLFNLRQGGNLLWGFQFPFYILVLCVVLAIYFLQFSKGLDWRFFAAVFCGIVGTFCVANGLSIWIIGTLQLAAICILQPAVSKGAVLRSLLVWIAVAAGIYAFYFWGYIKPSHHPSLLFFLQDPLSSLLYGFAAVGCLFSLETCTAIAIGIVIAALYIAAFILVLKDMRNMRSQLMSLSLILFTGASVALLVLGRSGFGINQALSNRYVTFTMIGIIGLYYIVIAMRPKFSLLKPVILNTAIVLLVVSMFSMDIYALVLYRGPHAKRFEAQQILLTYQTQSDEKLKLLLPDPNFVKQYSPVLIKYRLNAFYDGG